MRVEIRAGEGGADAEQFALQLANSIAKHSGATVLHEGKTLTLGSL